MIHHARIEDGKVAEIIAPMEGFALHERFHPDLVARCVAVDDHDHAPEPGWTARQSGGGWVFSPPEPIQSMQAPELTLADLQAQLDDLQARIATAIKKHSG